MFIYVNVNDSINQMRLFEMVEIFNVQSYQLKNKSNRSNFLDSNEINETSLKNSFSRFTTYFSFHVSYFHLNLFNSAASCHKTVV